ncbi:hypothetical protein D3C72_2347950 [compost metagenome]
MPGDAGGIDPDNAVGVARLALQMAGHDDGRGFGRDARAARRVPAGDGLHHLVCGVAVQAFGGLVQQCEWRGVQ